MSGEVAPRHKGGAKPAHEAGEFLTDEQLATMLRVTMRTTLRWRRGGGGPPYVRVGPRRVLYRRTDVLAWATARTFPSLAAEAVAKTN
jgi:hypothetical protein